MPVQEIKAPRGKPKYRTLAHIKYVYIWCRGQQSKALRKCARARGQCPRQKANKKSTAHVFAWNRSMPEDTGHGKTSICSHAIISSSENHALAVHMCPHASKPRSRTIGRGSMQVCDHTRRSRSRETRHGTVCMCPDYGRTVPCDTIHCFCLGEGRVLRSKPLYCGGVLCGEDRGMVLYKFGYETKRCTRHSIQALGMHMYCYNTYMFC